jgi:sulfide:quinone oxidoreductase
LGQVKTCVLILGAGFGGLELSKSLSEQLADEVEVTLIDRGEGFAFGFSKLEMLFGRASRAEVTIPYEQVSGPGVRFLREEVTAIDPEARTVRTDAGEHEAEILVVALGADYDLAATPGLAEDGNEFYSFAGAERAAAAVSGFGGGKVLIGVCGAPFKCPPAPSEVALLLHDDLLRRGLRERSEITLAMPLPSPVPPSPDTSEALLSAFAERGIEFRGGARIASLDLERREAVLVDGEPIPYDLFLGVPRHRAPDVVLASGMAVDGYVPVDSRTLETSFPGVYAVGDVATVGVPKAGVFAEGQARAVAEALVARIRDGGAEPAGYGGTGSCYVEFGAGRVGRVDVDFLSGPRPTGSYQAPSEELAAEKAEFGASRRARWFGAA